MLKAERNMVDELEGIKELGFQNCIEMSSNVCEVIFRKFENKELCRKIPV